MALRTPTHRPGNDIYDPELEGLEAQFGAAAISDSDRNTAGNQELQNLDDIAGDSSRSFYQRSADRAKDRAKTKIADILEEEGLGDKKFAQRFGPTSKQKNSSGLLSRNTRKAMLLFLAPSLVGLSLGIALLVLQGGFRIQHVNRISTTLRFGAFHRDLSNRLKHLQATSIGFGGDISNANATYARTTLGQRLTGWSPSKAITSIGLEGEFELRSERVAGRERITAITDKRTGRVYNARDPADLSAWKDIADNRLVSESGRNRFYTRRTTNHIFKKSAIPFARFQSVINRIRGGEQLSDVLVDQLTVAEDIEIKSRRPRSSTSNIGGVEDIADDAQDKITRGGSPSVIRNEIADGLRIRQAIWKGTGTLSTAAFASSLACVVRDIATQFEDAFKLRINGSQSEAAKLQTIDSQIKTGNMETQVVNSVDRKFDGFFNSATYLAGIFVPQSQIASTYDFSDKFSNVRVHGVPVGTILGVSNALKSATELGFVGSIPIIGPGIADFTSAQVDELCSFMLTTEGQIITATTEIVLSVVAAFFTGGSSGAAQLTVRESLRQVAKSIVSKRVALTIVGGVTWDYVLFQIIIPNMLDNITGLETVLLDEDEFGNPLGAQNYAIIDYGKNYLAQEDALANGASRIPVTDGLAKTHETLALYRQQEAEKGIVNNVLALDNPYSLASNLAVHTPASVQTGTNQFASLLASTFKLGGLFSFSKVSAQQSYSAELLFPGQTSVPGFADGEIKGEREGFDHVSNTVFVEQNISRLRADYSKCVGNDGFGALEYNLATAYEVGGFPELAEESYPSECDSNEARRYKLFIQDCLAIDQILSEQAGTSSFYGTACDEFVQNQSIDTDTNRTSQAPKQLATANALRAYEKVTQANRLPDNSQQSEHVFSNIASSVENIQTNTPEAAWLRRDLWFANRRVHGVAA